MKIFLYCLIGLLLIVALFNKKLNAFKIIKNQFIIYKDDRTGKTSLFDIFTFFIIPFLIAIAGGFLLEYDVFFNASGLCITVFSLIATILFSFLALLMDKKYNMKDSDEGSDDRNKFNQVTSETHVSITMTIIYSIVSVITTILLLIINNMIVMRILNGILLYLIIKIIFSFLMILKRMFILLQ